MLLRDLLFLCLHLLEARKKMKSLLPQHACQLVLSKLFLFSFLVDGIVGQISIMTAGDFASKLATCKFYVFLNLQNA